MISRTFFSYDKAFSQDIFLGLAVDSVFLVVGAEFLSIFVDFFQDFLAAVHLSFLDLEELLVVVHFKQFFVIAAFFDAFALQVAVFGFFPAVPAKVIESVINFQVRNFRFLQENSDGLDFT